MVVSTPYVIVFYSTGSPRDLHSFPTRRSSDLAQQRSRLPSRVERPSRRLDARRAARDDGADVRRAQLDVRPDGAKDRKSTRLNSSHVKSSYAVFCLKKKRRRRRPRI